MTRETQLGFQPPAIGEEEIEAVAETLRSGWLTTGPKAALLEERMAEYLEAKHVLAVASGTAAMHLALVALGIEPGDEVITTPITWPATANVIVHSGATPVFVDVREGDLNIDPALVGAAVTERTKAIMPVHLAGQPCRPRADLGARHARDRGRGARGRERATAAASSAGSPRRPASPLRDEEHRRRRGRARLDEPRRGRGRDPEPAPDAARRRLALRPHRARATRRTSRDVLAAIALVQLDKLPEHTAARERQFALYDEGIAELDGIEPLARDPRDTHALHLYVVRIDPARLRR